MDDHIGSQSTETGITGHRAKHDYVDGGTGPDEEQCKNNRLAGVERKAAERETIIIKRNKS